jgi:PAS domain S-box-containing protein
MEDAHPDGELWRTLVDGIADYAILLLDEGGRVRIWSAGAVRMLGYPAGEIRGEHLSRLYPGDDAERDTARRQLDRALAEGLVAEQGWMVSKPGARLEVNVIIRPLRGEAGRPLGFTGVVEDLTRRAPRQDRLSLVAERERIAKELQGRAVRTFFDVGLQLEAVANRIRDPEIGRYLEQCVTRLDEGITDLRRLAFDLSGPTGA